MKPSQQIPGNPHTLIHSRIQVMPERDDPINGMSLEDRECYNWDNNFVDMMKWRMIQGSFRYGVQTVSSDINNLSYAKTKIIQYELTGNLEALVDAANMLRLEFKFSKHPNKHFSSDDSGVHAI